LLAKKPNNRWKEKVKSESKDWNVAVSDTIDA